MAIENAKTLNVRIKNKYDSYENWAASGLVLEPGEIAIAYTTVNVTVDNGSIEQHPALLMKVGDGEKTFANLPWLSAKAADVPAYAKKSEADFKAWIKTIVTIDDVDTSAFAQAADLTAEIERAKAAEAQALTDAKAYTDAEITEWVGDKTVGTQISTAINDLDLANTYEAKGDAAQALTDAKAYADGLNAAEVKAREEAVAAVQGEVDALEQTHATDKLAIEASITAAQTAFNALNASVGTVPEGKTVVQMIEDAQTAATYDDTEVKADITALEGLVGDTAVATQISDAVAAEAEIARAAEKANADAIDAIEADYLKAADKTELQTQINTIMNNPDTEGVINSINEFTQYIADHGEIAEGFRTDIDANADAIEAIEADYLKAADKTALQDQITANDGEIAALQAAVGTKAAQADLEALAGRVTTVEGDLNTETTGLKARMTAAEADIDALETKVGDTPVADQITAAIEALKIGDYAKAADLTAAVARIAQNETDIAALEGRMDTAEGEIDALQTEIATKANDADLAAIAKTGSTDDLVQGDLVLLFDCGTSAV